MTPESICQILEQQFGDAIEATSLEGVRGHAQVAASRWPEVARFLRDDPRLRLNMLRAITSLDLLADNKLACVYDLLFVETGPECDKLITVTREFAVRVVCDRDDAHIPTVSDVWPAADWHEREAFDMMGIVFDNHPDHRRILCPDDWVGYPLRKDYDFPLEYHGIPATTEFELTNPRH